MNDRPVLIFKCDNADSSPLKTRKTQKQNRPERDLLHVRGGEGDGRKTVNAFGVQTF